MPIPQEKVLQYARDAAEYARAGIKKGNTQLENNAVSALLEDKEQAEEYLKSLDATMRIFTDENKKLTDERLQTSGILEDSVLVKYEATLESMSKYALGNCHELAILALSYMIKHHPEVEAQVYVIAGPGGDHEFLVLNSQQESKSYHANRPATWGQDAVICDPWSSTDRVYAAVDYRGRLKNYIYDSEHRTNHTEDLAEHHVLTPTLFNTSYILQAKTIEEVRKNFVDAALSLVVVLKNYISELNKEMKELNKIKEDNPKAGVLSAKIARLTDYIENEINIIVENYKVKEYKSYDEARSDLTTILHQFKSNITNAMCFTKAEKDILFAYPAISMRGLFGGKTATQENIENLLDDVNKKFSKMRVSS